jgi:hypothetical protein
MLSLPDELIDEITLCIKHRKVWQLTCCRIRQSVIRYPGPITNIENLRISFEQYPNYPWDYKLLSQNTDLPWSFILANLDKPWDYYWLSFNKHITYEIVLAHEELPWDYNHLVSNRNFTTDIPDGQVWKIIKKYNLRNSYFAANPNISPTTYPNLPHGCSWSYQHLSLNPNLTYDIVRNDPECKLLGSGDSWNYPMLASNLNFTNDYIKRIMNNYPEAICTIDMQNNRWDIERLSDNKNLTHDIVVAHPGHPWDHESLSGHPRFTWDIIIANTPLLVRDIWCYNTIASFGKIPWQILTVFAG